MGMKIGEVAAVSPASGLEAWTRFHVSYSNEPRDAGVPGFDLMKTLTRTRGGLHRLSRDQQSILFRSLIQEGSDTGASDSSTLKFVQRFLEEAHETMHARTCFVTTSGAFKMGLERIRPKDVLIRIPDSPGLTALLPLRLSDQGQVVYEHTGYTVVDDCHVSKLTRGRNEQLPTLEELQPFEIT
jgi:hypothetical protein